MPGVRLPKVFGFVREKAWSLLGKKRKEKKKNKKNGGYLEQPVANWL